MDMKIIPGPLKGSLFALASKSELHRMLICAAFSDKETELQLYGSAYDGKHPLPKDILATMTCLESLGARFNVGPGSIIVLPAARGEAARSPLLDCGESGSTLRFLLPVAAAVAEEASFTGTGRLPERPITGLSDALKAHGISFTSDRLPFSLSGRLSGGVFEIPGDISSQYLTGLMLTLPLLSEAAEIRLLTPLRSAAYIDITAQVMGFFGARITCEAGVYRLRERTAYKSPSVLLVGGDWSNMAAFLTAAALRPDSDVFCRMLYSGSRQGDMKILALLEKIGAAVRQEGNAAGASYGKLHGTEIDIDETPDLLPVLAVAACGAEGDTAFVNAGRLRLKESDRIASVAAMVRALGGSADEGPDRLTIHGTGTLSGGTVDAMNDHRIVMASAIAAGICTEPVIIRGAEAVEKSYPSFFEDFRSLKGAAYVL